MMTLECYSNKFFPMVIRSNASTEMLLVRTANSIRSTPEVIRLLARRRPKDQSPFEFMSDARLRGLKPLHTMEWHATHENDESADLSDILHSLGCAAEGQALNVSMMGDAHVAWDRMIADEMAIWNDKKVADLIRKEEEEQNEKALKAAMLINPDFGRY